MPRAWFWMTSNLARCAIPTDHWWRILMERNSSFVSGYLCEILPSAKEPERDLHVTQTSSEARPSNSFSRKGTVTSLRENLLNRSGKQIISPIKWAVIMLGKSGICLEMHSTKFSCETINILGFAGYMSPLSHIFVFPFKFFKNVKKHS